jgi:HEAT repeat protein
MPKLRQALSDKEVPVVVAAAHSLLLLKDKSAYDIYYAILTGQRRSSHGLIEEQMATLKDRRQMAEFGFEQAIGYVPFAGMGYDAIRALRKEDASPVRAAAARVLADDTDPSTGQALLETAVGDKEWVIRAAALDAIARRGDPALLEKLWPTLTDDKDPVRYTAAAAVLRLTAIAKNKVKNK